MQNEESTEHSTANVMPLPQDREVTQVHTFLTWLSLKTLKACGGRPDVEDLGSETAYA